MPPSLSRPPPLPAVSPPVIVSPENAALTAASTWNTRLRPPPLTVTPAAGAMMASVALVLLSSRGAPVSRIVCALFNQDRASGRVRPADRPAQRADGAVIQQTGDDERGRNGRGRLTDDPDGGAIMRDGHRDLVRASAGAGVGVAIAKDRVVAVAAGQDGDVGIV